MDIRTRFKDLFPYPPTTCQQKGINEMSLFLNAEGNNNIFLLTGYAGTGKTTFISVLVSLFSEIGKATLLLAPTGRAAKVVTTYTQKKAFTIHKRIYSLQKNDMGFFNLKLQPNFHRKTIIIVDEASMINNNGHKNEGNLLDDLVSYMRSGDNCRLILVGDEAQLPPVGSEQSPALMPKYLNSQFGFNVFHVSFTTVVRQQQESGILSNATALRMILNRKEISFPFFDIHPYKDIEKIQGGDFRDLLDDSYSRQEIQNVIILCRSNKRANLYNKHIRNVILFRENVISAGDIMMVVKNNYFWLPKTHGAGFIANGDIIEILRINKSYNLYGFDFADVTVRLTDYPDEDVFDTSLLLNTIDTDGPALSIEDSRRLFDEVSKDYEEIKSEQKKMIEIRQNPHLNALQVKFAYAITVHKAQGGQWHTVFIDHGFLQDETVDISFVRWLYTALTRATDKVWLVNFKDIFFEKNSFKN
ncbi:MAG: AAA family ATPase [Bacteroidales bacterium]|nr:AAA family ATPase [Bacteroidales bacterium]